MPQHSSRGDGAARPRVRGPAGRADHPLRGGRALAGTPRRRPPPPDTGVGGVDRIGARPRVPRCRSELAVDGLYRLDFAQTFEMGQGALETARSLGDRGLIGGRRSRPRPGRGRPTGAWSPRASIGRRRWKKSRRWRTPSWRSGLTRSTTWVGPRATWSTTTMPSGIRSGASGSRARRGRGACWSR